MRIGWLVAVVGGLAMLLAAATLGADTSHVEPAAAATAPALPTVKPLDANRYYVAGVVRTYSTPAPTSTPTPAPTATPTPPPGSCGDLLIHLSKTTGIPASCVPPDLQPIPGSYTYVVDDPNMRVRAEALTALVEMLTSAKGNGLTVLVRSAYRSYQEQGALFDYWVNLLGYDEAYRTSAAAGHSEHQLGTAVDLTSPSNDYDLDGFESTAEGQWLAQNSWRFGYVLSYPPGTEHVSGYAYEPWHFRYIGRENAQDLRDSGLTLHDFTAHR